MADDSPQQSTVNVTVQTPNQTTTTSSAPALQPINVLPPKATRTFSKYLVIINCALAWAAVFYIGGAQPAVALGALAMIAVFGAGYMGIGHKDLALLMRSLAPVQIGALEVPTELAQGDQHE